MGDKSVTAMQGALQGGMGQSIGQSDATCGDIVMVTGGSGANHVGICLSQGCSSYISNSSTNRTFSWNGTNQPVFYPVYGSGLARQFYRVTN